MIFFLSLLLLLTHFYNDQGEQNYHKSVHDITNTKLLDTTGKSYDCICFKNRGKEKGEKEKKRGGEEEGINKQK